MYLCHCITMTNSNRAVVVVMVVMVVAVVVMIIILSVIGTKLGILGRKKVNIYIHPSSQLVLILTCTPITNPLL